MIPFDLHTHCSLSFDGVSGAEEMVLRAAELGISYYALTDHVDLGNHADPDFDLEATVNGAKAQIPVLREKYSDSLTLLYGVELGQAVHDAALARKLLSENEYDFVIGSVHNIRGYNDFYFLDYSGLDVRDILRRYFEELLETAESDFYDVIGHITYPLRYIEGDHGIKVDMNEFSEIIDRILQTVIKKGRGIEINTSGLRQKIGRTMPGIDIVKRYRELGGEILTIGSDAHCTDDLGKGITDGITIARKAGFEHIAIFRKRIPEYINI